MPQRAEDVYLLWEKCRTSLIAEKEIPVPATGNMSIPWTHQVTFLLALEFRTGLRVVLVYFCRPFSNT